MSILIISLIISKYIYIHVIFFLKIVSIIFFFPPKSDLIFIFFLTFSPWIIIFNLFNSQYQSYFLHNYLVALPNIHISNLQYSIFLSSLFQAIYSTNFFFSQYQISKLFVALKTRSILNNYNLSLNHILGEKRNKKVSQIHCSL